MADYAAEAAATESANTAPISEEGASTEQSDNKFQKAISAWRSRWQPPMIEYQLTNFSNRFDVYDSIPG
jgi:hypothetical protein